MLHLARIPQVHLYPLARMTPSDSEWQIVRPVNHSNRNSNRLDLLNNNYILFFFKIKG
jgi:hypothetical protein